MTLESMRARQEEIGAAVESDLEEMRTAINEAATTARKAFGKLGERLSAIETELGRTSDGIAEVEARLGSLDQQLVALLDRSFTGEDGAALQHQLDEAYAHMGETAFAQSLAVIREHQDKPLFGRREDLETLDAFIENADRGTILLLGEAGLGKSRLLTGWTDLLPGPRSTVLRHFVSAKRPETTTRRAVLRSLARQAALHLSPKSLGEGVPGDADDLADRLARLLAGNRPEGERLVVVIDSLDEAAEVINPITLKLGRGVFLVASGRLEPGERPLFLDRWQYLGRRAPEEHLELTLSGLSRSAIAGWLAFALGRTVPEDGPLLEEAYRASEGIPLFASFMIPHAIDKLMAGAKEDEAFPPGFEDYARAELKALDGISPVGGMLDAAAMSKLFNLVLATKGPIGASDVSAILGWRPKPGQLDHRFERWFELVEDERDLRISFAHPRLAQVFRKVLPEEEVRDIETDLIEYCEKNWKGSRRRSGSRYALEWLPRHLLDWDEADEAARLLCDIDFLVSRLSLLHAEVLTTRTAAAVLEAFDRSSKDDALQRRLQWWATFWANCETPVLEMAKQGQFGRTTLASAFLQLVHDVTDDEIERQRLHDQAANIGAPFVGYGAHPFRLRQPELEQEHSDSHLSDVCYVPDPKDCFVSWGGDGTIRFWTLDGDPLPGSIAEAHPSNVKGVLPLEDRLVSWGADGAIRFWTFDGDPLPGGDPNAHVGSMIGVNGILLLEDRLISWGHDGAIRLWNLDGMPMPGGDPKAHVAVWGVLRIAGSLLSWGADGMVCLRTLDGQLLSQQLYEGPWRICGFRKIEDRLVSWDEGGSIWFWNLDGEPLPGGGREIHPRHVYDVIQASDRLISWGDDHLVRIWSLNGEPYGTLIRLVPNIKCRILDKGHIFTGCDPLSLHISQIDNTRQRGYKLCNIT